MRWRDETSSERLVTGLSQPSYIELTGGYYPACVVTKHCDLPQSLASLGGSQAGFLVADKQGAAGDGRCFLTEVIENAAQALSRLTA